MPAEQANVNQADLLAGVLDSSLDGIYAFQSQRDDAGQIVDFIFVVVNRAAEEMIGRSAEDLLGNRLLEMLPGNKTDGLFDAYVKVVETQKPFVTEHYYEHDGLANWYNISAAPYGDGFTVSFADITKRKNTEKYFRVLFESSTDAHLLFDDTGIIDCNQAAINMLGYEDKQELLSLHPAKLSPEFQPDGRRSMEKCVEMDQTAKDKGYHRFDWIHQRKDGSEIPVEVTLNPVKLSNKDALLVVWHDLTERVQAEQKASESAKQLKEAQELAKIGNWQWTTGDNVIVWSDEIKRMFGMPLNQPAPNFEDHRKQIHPEDVEYWESVLKQAAKDHQPYIMKFRNLLPNGQSRVLESRGQCELGPDGTLVRTYGTVQDITEQEASRYELDKLSIVASRTDNSVVITDAKGKIEWVNRAFVEMTGYPLEEVWGKTPGSVLQGQDTDPKAIKRIRKLLKSGQGFSETLLNYRKTGEPYWIEIEVQPIRNSHGQIINFMAIERNVTDRIEQQQELEEQRHRLEFALQASRSGLWDWQVESGETYFSDTWYTMLGYDVGELPMNVQCWIDITEPSDLKRATAALEDYFTGVTDRYTCEIRVKNKSGDWQWILDLGEAVERDENGKVTRMVGLHVDIHDQKTTQQLVEQARDQAEQASHAKSAFVANMSHEIRTPMNAILGYADLLLDGGQTEADKRNHAQTIRRNGKHLLSIINDILDLSKIEAGKLSIEQVTCDPKQIFEDIISLMAPKAGHKGIGLSFHATGELPGCFKSDPTRIRQVVINLLGNAIKFTEQGEVRLAVRVDPVDDHSANLICEVTDTGIGISSEEIDKLFEPFSQADESTTRRFGGTGLGLSISKNLCEILNGKLSCTSTPGQGSTFTATFRVKSMKTCPADLATSKTDVGRANENLSGKRILIVEDGPDNQRLLNHYLIKADAAVVLAENGVKGKDAVLAAHEAGQPFDAVLMDMQMPVLDGYSATRQLRMAGYNLPIIALTAHASSDDRDKCLDVGCTDYLSKPVDRNRLIQTIASYTGSARHQRAEV